jgi:hypothetical protein
MPPLQVTITAARNPGGSGEGATVSMREFAN